MDGVSSAAKLQVHDILKAGCHAVSVVAKDAVPQGGVCKIEFFLRFQDLLTLQIKARAAVKQIGFLQFFQVAVNRFVVQRTVLRFQIIRNGFCREGVAHIAEGVLDHSFQLINLPHLIALDNIGKNRGVMIWKSIPSQLARENKKFIYKVVKEGARAREYEDALQWLVDARLVHKIYRSTAPGLPVAAYDDLSAFKIYLVDVGLLRRLAQLAPTAFGEGNRLFTEFKGALTENFVLQTLITQFEVVPRYWSQNNPPYEVDFLIQRENDIFPVEVKSETNTTSKSLKKFKEMFPDQVKLRVRFSLDNLKLDDDVLNIPLFMADQADRLIGLALEKKNSFGQ